MLYDLQPVPGLKGIEVNGNAQLLHDARPYWKPLLTFINELHFTAISGTRRVQTK